MLYDPKDKRICSETGRNLQVGRQLCRPSKGPFATDRFALAWHAEPGLRLNPPDPFPNGHRIGLDLALTALTACVLALPSPTKGRGHWRIVCNRCRVAVSLPTTGHRDDPCTVRLPCRLH